MLDRPVTCSAVCVCSVVVDVVDEEKGLIMSGSFASESYSLLQHTERQSFIYILSFGRCFYPRRVGSYFSVSRMA